MQNYFYRDKAGREIGPFDLVTLSKFRMAGVLDGDTPVRVADSAEWKPCREVVADSPTPSTAPPAKEAVKKSSNGILIALIGIVIVVIIATRSSTQHAAEAEKAFRKQFESQRQGIKVVNFKATSGQSFFKTNFLNSSVVESYKLFFEAELEFEMDMTIEKGVDVQRGDRARFAGTMIGEIAEDGWKFGPCNEFHVSGASSPSLFSKIKNAEDANLRQARAVSQANACINNLRQIDAAGNEFALEKGKRTGDPIDFPSDLTPYIKLTAAGKIPSCPAGGIYTINRVGDIPTCSLGNMVTPNHVLP